ncbi:MAG TPA: C-GCAxxG-C-C family protein [Negativicutes bacterium]|nr:C-GCAxxG-C-C family protein [Negativicutes bacterium]
MTEDSARVVTLHNEGGINCSQAILCVYGKYFGVPEELAIKVATALGAGMGGMGKTCGAVTGAFLVLGLTYEIGNPGSRGEVYSLVKEFTKKFIARHGSISCAELLGYDMGTEEGLKMIREQKLTKTICPGIDKSAAELVEELLVGKLPTTPE